MPYAPILATLGYVLSPDGREVLLVHRDARPDDPHFGKFNGLGGKLEPNEDIISGIRREIKEEANLDVEQLKLRATISWPGFGKQGEDWFGFLFRILDWTGKVAERSPEGPLEWIPIDRIDKLNLWDGDRYFLPIVLDFQALPFHGVMPYKNGKLVSWQVSRIGV